MRFFLPDPYLEPDKKEFLYGIREDDHSRNQSLLDKLLNDDENMIFFDMDTDRLCPLRTSGDIGYDYDDWTLYNLLTLDFKGKEVYYVSGDFNIHTNLERLKEAIKIDIKTDIKSLIYPQTYTFRNGDTYGDNHFEINNFTFKVNDIVCTESPRYNVVSLNCTRKPHRIDLIRALHNEENFIYSYYPFEDEDQIESFFETGGEVELLKELTELNELYDRHLSLNRNEKNIKERTKEELIRDLDSKHHSRQESVPLEYIRSCIDLITEAYFMDSALLTEKAFKPIAYRKPFIILGPRHSHQFLERIGFKLYDELFDYSFDDKSYEERLNSIISQIKEILKIPTLELVNRCKDLNEKIEHNYKVLHESERIDMIDVFRDEGVTKSDLEVLEIFKKDQEKYVLDIR